MINTIKHRFIISNISRCYIQLSIHQENCWNPADLSIIFPGPRRIRAKEASDAPPVPPPEGTPPSVPPDTTSQPSPSFS